jgi:hypothetical protein
MIDELTHFTEKMYRFLRGRVRMIGLTLPSEYQGKFPRILCGSNPGNIGHLWVKTTFISGAPPFEIRRMKNAEGGMLRQFIPGRLEDNPSMTEDDPEYEARLEGLGSATLVKAMRTATGMWSKARSSPNGAIKSMYSRRSLFQLIGCASALQTGVLKAPTALAGGPSSATITPYQGARFTGPFHGVPIVLQGR